VGKGQENLGEPEDNFEGTPLNNQMPKKIPKKV